MTLQDYDSRYFESRFTPNAERDGIWREIAAYLQARYIPASAAVLDMGAGYCSFINHVQAAQRFALDLFPQVGEYAAPGVQAAVGSCTDLSRWADASLDAIFASNLLEHLTRPDIEATLSEVRRALRPTGHLILIQPNFRYCSREYFDDYTHLQIFTHVSLSDWLTAAGLRVVQQEPRFLPFSFKSRLPKWPWLARLYLRLPYRPLAKQMLIVAQK